MIFNLVTPPVLEPITLAELKLHLRLDSGSLADNIDETQSIAPGLKTPATYTGTAIEVLGYSAVVEFSAGAFVPTGTVDIQIYDCDTLTGTYIPWGTAFVQVTTGGMLTSAALAKGSTPEYVANGIFDYFIVGTAYSKPANGAGTSPATGTPDDTIPQGKYGAVAFEIGVDNIIDVIDAPGNDAGYTTAALALAGLPVAPVAGHVRIGTVTAMRALTFGDFVFGTTPLDAAHTTVAYTQATLKANYNTTYEMAYTGTKRYIKTVAIVGTANCEFGTSVIRMGPTSVEDTLLNDHITTARENVEDITHRQLLTATWDYYLDEWPEDNFIKLPFGNLQAVTHVKWKDIDGVETNFTKTITAFAASSVSPATKTKVTCAAHGLADGITAFISGTTNYDGAWAISNVGTDIFDITTVFVADDATGTVTEDYIVEKNGEKCGRIVLPYGTLWPLDILYPSNPIVIRFVCGWTTAALVPSKIKSAIKMVCSKLYEGRGEDVLGQTVSEDKVVDRLLSSAILWDDF